MDAQTALEQLATIYDRDLQPAEAAAEAMTIYLEMGERIAELDVIRASAKQVLADVLAEIGADRLETAVGVAYVTAPSIRSNYDAKGLDKLGTEVLELCDGSRRVEEIVDEFAAKHRLTFHESRVAVTGFLRSLVQRGLIAIEQQQ